MHRAIYIALSITGSAGVAYFSADSVRGNKDLLSALLTTFTVFGGFLVAIITLTGDPSFTRRGSWRIAESRRSAIEGPLARQRALFYLYLANIFCIIIAIAVLVGPEQPKIISDVVDLWVTRTYIALSVLSFVFTLSLPQAIISLQQSRMDTDIEDRRKPQSRGVKSEVGWEKD